MNPATIFLQASEVRNIPGITLKSFIFYILLIAVPGYLFEVLPLPINTPELLIGAIWFSYFILTTYRFKSIRQTIISQLDVRCFKRWRTYFYILISLILPYAFLHFCLNYGFLLDKNYIFYFKNHMIPATGIGSTINSSILTPITEEILFRGILLVFLLKFMKPYLAVGIVAILFSILHPWDIWIFILLSGFLLTITAYKTKSLLPSMVAHGLWNLYMTQLFLYF